MNPSEIIALLCALGAAATTWLNLSLRATVAELKTGLEKMRTEIADHRREDMEQTRTWINGSFMRAPEVRAMLTALDGRVSALEKASQ